MSDKNFPQSNKMQELKKENTTSEPSLSYLVFLLSLTCVNLLANNLLQGSIRTYMSFWSVFIPIYPKDYDSFSGLPKYLSLTSIFTGPFSGYITDLLSAPVALVLMSMISVFGLTIFYFTAKRGASGIWYKIAMLIYGGAMNNARIPMQKMCTQLFQGPNLAFFMNVNHTFSHLSAFLANQIAAFFESVSGFPAVFQTNALIGMLTFPICLCLYSFYTLKLSVKSKKKANTNILVQIKKFFTETEPMVFFIVFLGYFIDVPNVSFKNTESSISKSIFNLNQEQTRKCSDYAKFSLLFTPFYSKLVDLYCNRGFWLITTSSLKMCYYFYLRVLAVRFQKAGSLDAVTKKNLFKRLLFLRFVDSGVMAIFYATFYSYFGVIVNEEIRGIAFGCINSILSVGYFFFPSIVSKMAKDGIQQLTIFIIMAGVGVGLTVLAYLIDMSRGNTMKTKSSKAKK